MKANKQNKSLSNLINQSRSECSSSSLSQLTNQLISDSRQSIGQYDYDRLIYYPTHARCGPWFVGMMLGFVMYQYRNNKPEINRSLSRFLWVLSISLLFLVVLGYFPFQQADRYLKISNAVNASYNALYRTCWAIGLAWIIFACHNGSGGIIRWFLCLPHFKPLARMSLSVYLSHRVYQIVSVASMRQPIHLRPLALLHLFFGDVIISIIVGTLVYLCIEAPTAVLEARLFKRKKLINWNVIYAETLSMCCIFWHPTICENVVASWKLIKSFIFSEFISSNFQLALLKILRKAGGNCILV